MKQTNNAIKFLMAQYRAIFKNAYFKGLTSAVLLTAGLAVAGSAQAAGTNFGSLPDHLTKLADQEEPITIVGGDANGDNGKYAYLNLQQSGDAGKITWNADVTIESGAATWSNTGNFIAAPLAAANDVIISGRGSLTVDGSDIEQASDVALNVAVL